MYSFAVEDEIEEVDDMGSFNHGYIQARLVVLLDRTGTYTLVNELSLDISGIDLSRFDLRTKNEVKPDISLYPRRGLSRPTDILRMSEMPLLAIEILSPKQGTYEILEKFKAYFELGIKSCWLVDPAINTVTVYSSIDHWQTFSNGEVIDDTVGLRLAIDEIFA
jgi:Uma2 family endonuclease